MSPTVLFIALDRETVSTLRPPCESAGFTVRIEPSTAAAGWLRGEQPALVLVDDAAFEADELDVTASVPVVPIGRAADAATVVRAMRRGAWDFLNAPVSTADLEPLLARLRAERQPDAGPAHWGPMVGRSESIRSLWDQLQRVARTPRTTVLIQGESGVGKELVARAVHDRSGRADRPFVALNCAALTESLLEAELFGYEAGSFTGGSPKGRTGLLDAAEGGSLLLDEIGELAPALQAKLLRVLQERTFRRVGGHRDLPIDVRIIASTNRDLEDMVASGRFREDLFYRLNVMSLRVPSLRDRPGDIALLAQHFAEQISAEFDQSWHGFGPGTLEALRRHSWPGNVRELRNVIERAVLLNGPQPLQAAHVRTESIERGRSAVRGEDVLPLGDRSLRSVEEALIRRVLEESAGNRSRAAEVLGINRTTLYNKLKTYRILSPVGAGRQAG